MSFPFVSVFLPTHSRNNSGMLSNAIESVLNQSVSNFELFVVDDGSTDGSADTIANFAAKDRRVRHLRFDRNVGLPALTCAKAFGLSSGDFIAWQFDDCTWDLNFLRDLLNLAADDPGAGVFYGQAKMVTEGSPIILGERFDRQNLLHRNFIPNCATLTRRSVFHEVGWLDPSVILKRICDYDLWVRASDRFRFSFLDKVVAIENGLTLPDSLGNSVTLSSALSGKYRAHDRSSRLQICNMESWDPCLVEDWMDFVDRKNFAQLVFEHFFRVGQHSRAISKVIAIIPEIFPGVLNDDGSVKSDEIAWHVFDWYLKMIPSASKQRESEMSAYIGEQHAYIERQHRMINDLEVQLNSRFSAFKRLVKGR